MPHPLKGHWSRDDSEPLQATLFIQMGPLPWPNTALVKDLAVPLYPSCLHTTWVQAQKSMHLCWTILFIILNSSSISYYSFCFLINLCRTCSSFRSISYSLVSASIFSPSFSPRPFSPSWTLCHSQPPLLSLPTSPDPPFLTVASLMSQESPHTVPHTP